MATYQWKDLLTKWSSEVLETKQRDRLPADVVASAWLGFPPATSDEIRQLEDRLALHLPPSYREFLGVTNGWRMTTPFIQRLWPTSAVEWFGVRRPDWVAAEIEGRRYYQLNDDEMPHPRDAQYGPHGEPEPLMIGERELRRSLEIGSGQEPVTDAYLLLQPPATESGTEWEACYFSAKFDSRRHSSFWQLMLHEHEMFLRLKDM